MNDQENKQLIVSEGSVLGNGVNKQPLFTDNPLPLLMTPSAKEIDLKKWITDNQHSIENDLVQYGGILFRGFEINTVEIFNRLTTCFNGDPVPYMFRSSPRYSLAENVYVSTTYPQKRSINMHSESSYSYAWGRKIIFCCLIAPEYQGETPIADNRKVLSRLSKNLVEKFEEKGVLYQRNLSPHIGMPWQEVFQTNNPDEVKIICNANQIEYRFVNDSDLIIRWKRPAIAIHPDSGEKMWFNHSYFFNKFSMYEELGISESDDLQDDLLPSDTYFGDGTKIEYDEYLEIKNAYDREKVMFTWKVGDVLLLDNMLVAHGRSPYKGDRKIVVAIMEPCS